MALIGNFKLKASENLDLELKKKLCRLLYLDQEESMNYACVYVNGFSLPPVSPLVDMAVNKCAATKIHVNQCNLWTWFTFLQNDKQDISFVLTWYI